MVEIKPELQEHQHRSGAGSSGEEDEGPLEQRGSGGAAPGGHKFIGVSSKPNKSGRYSVMMRVPHGAVVRLGTDKDAERMARVADAGAFVLRGTGARLNFPESYEGKTAEQGRALAVELLGASKVTELEAARDEAARAREVAVKKAAAAAMALPGQRRQRRSGGGDAPIYPSRKRPLQGRRGRAAGGDSSESTSESDDDEEEEEEEEDDEEEESWDGADEEKRGGPPRKRGRHQAGGARAAARRKPAAGDEEGGDEEEQGEMELLELGGDDEGVKQEEEGERPGSAVGPVSAPGEQPQPGVAAAAAEEELHLRRSTRAKRAAPVHGAGGVGEDPDGGDGPFLFLGLRGAGEEEEDDDDDARPLAYGPAAVAAAASGEGQGGYKSQYKGCSWNHSTRRWTACLRLPGGKSKYIGSTGDERQCAHMSDAAQFIVRGPESPLMNFPADYARVTPAQGRALAVEALGEAKVVQLEREMAKQQAGRKGSTAAASSKPSTSAPLKPATLTREAALQAIRARRDVKSEPAHLDSHPPPASADAQPVLLLPLPTLAVPVPLPTLPLAPTSAEGPGALAGGGGGGGRGGRAARQREAPSRLKAASLEPSTELESDLEPDKSKDKNKRLHKTPYKTPRKKPPPPVEERPWLMAAASAGIIAPPLPSSSEPDGGNGGGNYGVLVGGQTLLTGKRQTSMFFGVSWHQHHGRWNSQIAAVAGMAKRTNVSLGYHIDEIQAAKIRDAGAIVLQGSAARLNFPEVYEGLDAAQVRAIAVETLGEAKVRRLEEVRAEAEAGQQDADPAVQLARSIQALQSGSTKSTRAKSAKSTKSSKSTQATKSKATAATTPAQRGRAPHHGSRARQSHLPPSPSPPPSQPPPQQPQEPVYYVVMMDPAHEQQQQGGEMQLAAAGRQQQWAPQGQEEEELDMDMELQVDLGAGAGLGAGEGHGGAAEQGGAAAAPAGAGFLGEVLESITQAMVNDAWVEVWQQVFADQAAFSQAVDTGEGSAPHPAVAQGAAREAGLGEAFRSQGAVEAAWRAALAAADAQARGGDAKLREPSLHRLTFLLAYSALWLRQADQVYQSLPEEHKLEALQALA